MHDEVFTKKAAALFPKLAQFREFYLVGGTALALYLGHRISVDFDLFTSQALSLRLFTKIKKVFSGSAINVTYRAPEQLNCIIDGVKFTFFSFEYPLVDSTRRYKKVPLVSMRELAAMKAFAIGKRLSYKDYVDWYFLLSGQHVELSEVLKVAKKKFRGDFNDRLFLGQLVSLNDVPTQNIEFLRGQIGRGKIQKFLEQTVKNFRP